MSMKFGFLYSSLGQNPNAARGEAGGLCTPERLGILLLKESCVRLLDLLFFLDLVVHMIVLLC